MDNNTLEKLNNVVEAFRVFHEEKRTIVNYKTPIELKNKVDLTLGDASDPDSIVEYMQNVLEYSVKTGSKQYLNQLFSGYHNEAVLGELLATLMNTSMYTYEVSQLATLMEKSVINKMNSYSGFVHGDGIFTSGGSNSNLVAMLCARHAKFPHFKDVGLFGAAPISAFVSDQCHYSFQKAAYILGLGSKYLIAVESDELGKMKPKALEQEIKASIERGEQPFFVAATSGTTELGAIDPIEEINTIAKKYDIWCHVDGSWGGSIILSDIHKALFKGLENVDSFAWNAHKLMNVPLICSALLVRENGMLDSALSSSKTDYIFHDHSHNQYDLGTKSLQCGRRNDAFKIWFAWKFKGDSAYATAIENLMVLAQQITELIDQDNRLELLAPTQTLNINFRYKPTSNGQDINQFNIDLREKLIQSGKSMVNYCHLGDDVSIRLVLVNHKLELSDLKEFLSHLHQTAREMEQINIAS